MKAPLQQLLLIDIGNTRLKWATSGEKMRIRTLGDISTKRVSAAWLSSLAKQFPTQLIVLASVVPKLLPTFRRAFSKRLVEVTSATPHLGLRFDYPKPTEIGADRLAAAVAAHAAGHYPTIIVACGTATAFSALDAKGRFCGGAISPGLQAQLDSLLSVTAQLPATKLRYPRTALARSTQDAISAGVMLNFQGGVNEIIRELSKALTGRSKPRILLTGGNAHLFAGKLDHAVALRPLLVFEGLHIIGLRSQAKTL